MQDIRFTHRLAHMDDCPAILTLMQAAIAVNMKGFLTNAEIKAAQETMGLDTTLIEDQTYFVIEALVNTTPVMVGCGGWGKRRTLYGGNHTSGRDDSFADPDMDPARIRAMYTHPDWTRKGIGALLLSLGEEAARQAGFNTIELGSTLPGEPLYKAHGYQEFFREEQQGKDGLINTIIHMRKTL